MIDDKSAMPALFESMVGMQVSYKTLYVGKWTMRRMLSNRYASKRVFLAGDSAHLVTPNGGLGMNTGIGDAIDLAWKLAGTLKGWGDEGLFATYEFERRLIGERNVKASQRTFEARLVWRDRCAAECSAVMESNDQVARIAPWSGLARRTYKRRESGRSRRDHSWISVSEIADHLL